MKLYISADVFVSSLFESFGISIVEAQAAGKPVIGTRTGGLPEALIENKTGLLVEPRDSKQLEVAILKVLLNPELNKELGKEGQTFVKLQYSMQSTLDDVISTYSKIIK